MFTTGCVWLVAMEGWHFVGKKLFPSSEAGMAPTRRLALLLVVTVAGVCLLKLVLLVLVAWACGCMWMLLCKKLVLP
jgi:hypothetical protein